MKLVKVVHIVAISAAASLPLLSSAKANGFGGTPGANAGAQAGSISASGAAASSAGQQVSISSKSTSIFPPSLAVGGGGQYADGCPYTSFGASAYVAGATASIPYSPERCLARQDAGGFATMGNLYRDKNPALALQYDWLAKSSLCNNDYYRGIAPPGFCVSAVPVADAAQQPSQEERISYCYQHFLENKNEGWYSGCYYRYGLQQYAAVK